MDVLGTLVGLNADGEVQDAAMMYAEVSLLTVGIEVPTTVIF